MSHSIKAADFEQLLQNQENCAADAPFTTRATFKLSALVSLIEAIGKNPLFKLDGEKTHNVCISFVRESVEPGTPPLLYDNNPNHPAQLRKHALTKGKAKYSQLIPVITGCVCELDENYEAESFIYLRNDSGDVLAIRPGGESTGLIPPPPPPSKDDPLS